MKIRFYATLRQIVGQKIVEISLPDGADVRQMVNEVAAQYPDLRRNLLDEASGKLHGHIHIFINGRDAPYMDHGLDTVLTADDLVDIFPAVGGG